MKTKTGLIPPKTVIGFFWSCFALSVTVCFFLTSCNSKDDFPDPASADAGTLTSKSLQCGRVFRVTPSGNYNDDSYNIQTALDAAVVAGRGSTVQLTKGTFYLKDRIEVNGFEGYFKGAGKDKTILTTHDQVVFDIPANQIPCLIKFRCGNINMSDMTISITNPEPYKMSDPNWSGFFNPTAVGITGNDLNPGPEGQPGKFAFHNLKFIGGDGTLWGLNYNLAYFIEVMWESDNTNIYPLIGGYKITNCEFQKAYFCICTIYTCGPSIIGGNEMSGNRFLDTEAGVSIMDLDNSCNITSYNFFERVHWLGVMDWQGVYADPNTLKLSKFIVSNNCIGLNSYTTGGEAFTVGINPVDYGIFTGNSTESKLDVVVSNNKVQINDIGYGGIIPQDLKNPMISHNSVFGKGTTGIGAGFWTKPPDYTEYDQESGYLIKGNNVKGMDASVAPIWLGPGTSNFLVYADKKDVLDEGTNNTVIGDHNKRSGHPGPEFREKMMLKYEFMKSHTHKGMK